MEYKNTNKDKDLTGASYLMQFYNRVIMLNEYSANYTNLLVEVAHTYGVDPTKLKSLQPEHIQILKNTVQSLRQEINVTALMFQAINNSLPETNRTALREGLLEDINKDFIINTAIISEYADCINGFLVKTIIQNFLTTSKDLLTSLYHDE